MEATTTDESTMSRPEPARSEELCLLSIDGGGIRGLSALQIIKQLMQEIDHRRPPKPCQYFNMIGGTSTGGLIAIMLGRLQMTVDECIEKYCILADKVFTKKQHRINFWHRPWNWETQARFDSEALKQAVIDILQEKGLCEDTLLQDNPDAPCKVFVCAEDKEVSKTVILSSYPSQRWSAYSSTKLWEAVRATSAATTFFEPMEIHLGSSVQTFVDGATGANNPVFKVWNEARDVWKDRGRLENNLTGLVSVGTGMPSLKPFGDTLAKIGKTLLRIATETEDTAEEFVRHHTELDDDGRYFRFNVTHGLENIGLEDSQRRNTIMAATSHYLSQEANMKQIKRCGQVLEAREWQKLVLDAAWAEHKSARLDYNWLENGPYTRSYLQTSKSGWLIQSPEYREWVSSHKSSVLWHPGPPETGKSSLMVAIIATHCRNIDLSDEAGPAVIMYFGEHYISGSRATVNNLRSETREPDTVEMILRSLIGQLLYMLRGSINVVLQNLQRKGKSSLWLYQTFIRGRNAMKIDVEGRLWEFFKFLVSSLHLGCYVYLDGVDRFTLAVRQEFLRNLGTIVRQQPFYRLKVFIATRPYEDIQRTLHPFPSISSETERKKWHDRRQDVKEAMEGTYLWVYEHESYKAWSRQTAGVLYIQGKPGCGKSTLAKMILQKLVLGSEKVDCQETLRSLTNLRPRTTVADFFYSSRNKEVGISHSRMLRSLLWQILNQDHDLYPQYSQHLRRLGDKPDDESGWTCEELLNLFHDVTEASARQGSRVCCVLDAMDESEDQQQSSRARDNVLRTLVGLVEKPYSRLKLIVLSRPANDIEEEVSRFHHIILEDHNAPDIEKYVNERLKAIDLLIRRKESSPRRSHVIPVSTTEGTDTLSVPPSPLVFGDRYTSPDHTIDSTLQEVGDYILSKANGVFVWVELILEELTKHIKKGHYTPGVIRRKLKDMPTHLDTLYKDIVSKLRCSLRKDETIAAKSILSWICFAKRPLVLKEVRDVIALSLIPDLLKFSAGDYELDEERIPIRWRNWEPIRRYLVDICGCLVEVVKSGVQNNSPGSQYIDPEDLVQVFHQTTLDFLVLDEGAYSLKLDPRESNLHIGVQGLAYLQNSISLPSVNSLPVSKWQEDDYTLFIRQLEDRPLLCYILSSQWRHEEIHSEASKYLDSLRHHTKLHPWCLLQFWCWNTSGGPNIMTGTAEEAKELSVQFREKCFLAAATNGFINVTYLMLSLSRISSAGMTHALILAVRGSHERIAAVLLDAPHELDISSLKQVLIEAAERGLEDIVRRVLQTGLVSASDSWNGLTPLHAAARGGNVPIIHHLVAQGADVEARDDEGKMPIHHAVSTNYREAIMALQGLSTENRGWNPDSGAPPLNQKGAMHPLALFSNQSSVYRYNEGRSRMTYKESMTLIMARNPLIFKAFSGYRSICEGVQFGYRGSHWILRDGAILISSAENVDRQWPLTTARRTRFSPDGSAKTNLRPPNVTGNDNDWVDTNFYYEDKMKVALASRGAVIRRGQI